LEQAFLGREKSAALPEGHPDLSFFQGKRYAAEYYAQNVLPGVMDKADILGREDRSALGIPDAAFAQV
jgi:hypothetical protein